MDIGVRLVAWVFIQLVPAVKTPGAEKHLAFPVWSPIQVLTTSSLASEIRQNLWCSRCYDCRYGSEVRVLCGNYEFLYTNACLFFVMLRILLLYEKNASRFPWRLLLQIFPSDRVIVLSWLPLVLVITHQHIATVALIVRIEVSLLAQLLIYLVFSQTVSFL